MQEAELESYNNELNNTAVLFLIFNRLSTSKLVFEAIRKAKPKRLYIASDGHRDLLELEKISELREYLLSNIDWDCQIKTLFREHNLGCGAAVSNAIDWFFENEEEGIILEDDCVPSEDFFTFTSKMLEKYRNFNQVGLIGGFNMFSNEFSTTDSSYSFINLPIIWGWATWKRTWNNYKFDISTLSKLEISKAVKSATKNKSTARFFIDGIYETSTGKIDTWDYQLVYSLFNNRQLVVTPNSNLIINVGFGSDATHTTGTDSRFSKAKFESLKYPYLSPEEVKCEAEINSLYERHMYNKKWYYNILASVKSLLKKIIRR